MKTIISISFVLLPYFALAQFERGQIYLGGTISGSLATTNSPNSTTTYFAKTVNNQLSVSPSIGFFLNPKFAVGGGVGYSTTYNAYYNNNPNTNLISSTHDHNFFIGPFARYYIPVTGSFFIVLQGQLSFNRGVSTIFNPVTGQVQETPMYRLGATLSPFFTFFPSAKWAVEAGIGSIGYTYTRTLPDVSSTNTFALSSGFFSFGLGYYFGRK
jgi:hypothetical protein